MHKNHQNNSVLTAYELSSESENKRAKTKANQLKAMTTLQNSI